MSALQAIKEQVKTDSPHSNAETVEMVALGLAEDAIKKLYKFRATVSGKANLYNKTREHFANTGCTEELAKLVAQYAVDAVAKRMYPASI